VIQEGIPLDSSRPSGLRTWHGITPKLRRLHERMLKRSTARPPPPLTLAA
jgi:hypothetical protein